MCYFAFIYIDVNQTSAERIYLDNCIFSLDTLVHLHFELLNI